MFKSTYGKGVGTTTMCNSFNFVKVAIVLLSAPLLADLIDRQVCLTWKATKNELIFKCVVFNLQTEVLLIDEYDYIRANCSMRDKLHCVESGEGDIIVEISSKNDLFLVLRTSSKDVDGNWKCRHGSREAKVNVLISKGAVYSADVHLSGEYTQMKNRTEFNLTCFSCRTPYMKSVTFFVNNVLKDSISYNDGKCYHKRTLCKTTECTCSAEGHTFSWRFNDDSSYLEFTCEMRFIDEIKSQIIIHTAKLFYNGTELIQEINGTRNIQVSDEDTPTDPHGKDTDSELLVYSIAGSICFLVIFGVITIGCMFRCSSPKQDTEICATCKQMPISAICADCSHAYCHICATDHLNHRICQINHVAVSETRIHCKKCAKKLADFFCKLCWIPNCDSCYENHSPKGHTLRIDQGLKQSSYAQQVKYKFNIPIKGDVYPVRICGIAYLSDGRIVVVDCNNYKLIVFKSRCQQQEHTLTGEPRAMTAMMGNNIAITFSSEKQIQILEISESRLTVRNIFDLKSLKIVRPTPFSIAYDQGYLAVEVGEGEDGRIIILDSKLSVWKTVSIGSQYAFFTGSTIRLALDVSNEGRIYISSMSKKMVSCINFKSQKLWTITVLSPRSIIILPLECSSVKRIILSSRKSDTIFELNSDNGTDEILLTKGKINSPRYMTYNSTNQNLCIQVSKKNHEDELVVFDLNEPDNSNPSTPLIENEEKM